MCCRREPDPDSVHGLVSQHQTRMPILTTRLENHTRCQFALPEILRCWPDDCRSGMVSRGRHHHRHAPSHDKCPAHDAPRRRDNLVGMPPDTRLRSEESPIFRPCQRCFRLNVCGDQRHNCRLPQNPVQQAGITVSEHAGKNIINAHSKHRLAAPFGKSQSRTSTTDLNPLSELSFC